MVMADREVRDESDRKMRLGGKSGRPGQTRGTSGPGDEARRALNKTAIGG